MVSFSLLKLGVSGTSVDMAGLGLPALHHSTGTDGETRRNHNSSTSALSLFSAITSYYYYYYRYFLTLRKAFLESTDHYGTRSIGGNGKHDSVFA